RIQGLRRRTNWLWRKRLMSYALELSRGELSEDAWGTLRTFPEVVADHGEIDATGLLAKLIFEAVLGTEKVDEKLIAIGKDLGNWKPLTESIDELLQKEHRPSCDKARRPFRIYIPYQGLESPDDDQDPLLSN